MFTAAVRKFILNAARKSDKMLEPCESKGSRTVLREERDSNVSDLLDYTRLTKALKGEVITVSSTSKHHINAMDLNKAYGGDADPVILKSQFLMSLCELMINDRHLGAKEKSIIDRCQGDRMKKIFKRAKIWYN